MQNKYKRKVLLLKAFEYHSQGEILKAENYYKNFKNPEVQIRFVSAIK